MNERKHRPAHLVNAGLSLIGLITCTVIGGELIADIMRDEKNFEEVPDWAKLPAVVVFLAFATLEANKVRSRLTRARGGFNGGEEQD